MSRSPSSAAAAGRTRPYTIGMLAPCPFPSHQGTQVFIRHLASALSGAGHGVHLVTYGHGEYEELGLPFQMHRAAAVDVGLRSGPSLRRPLADAALFVTALEVARRHHPDVWHAHNIEGLALGILLQRLTRVPLVYHAHNTMALELPTYYRHGSTRALVRRAGGLVDRSLPRLADATVVFDDGQRRLLEANDVAAARLHVILPGQPEREAGAAAPGMVARLRARLGVGAWLIYAGNPDRYQNLPLLWQALPRVRAVRADVRVLVATSHRVTCFADEYREAGSPAGVVFERYRDVGELDALLALARVGLCPRALEGGAPIKVLSYVAAGVPVVACRPGAGHLVTPECGLVVEPTVEAFAAGVLRLLEAAPDADAVQQAGRKRFSIERQVAQYEAVYAAVTRRALGRAELS